MRWHPTDPNAVHHVSTAIYNSIEALEAIHGHDGRAKIVWLDEEPCKYNCTNGLYEVFNDPPYESQSSGPLHCPIHYVPFGMAKPADTSVKIISSPANRSGLPKCPVCSHKGHIGPCRDCAKWNRGCQLNKGAPTMKGRCGFGMPWAGQCTSKLPCKEHSHLSCSDKECENPATYGCSWAGQFVCGRAWCSKHRCVGHH